MNDLFDAYINGTLGEEKKSSLEEQLEHNTQLKNEFTSYLLGRQAIEQTEEERLKTKIKQVTRSDMGDDQAPFVSLEKSNPGRSRAFRWISVAASLALFVGIGYFLLHSARENNTEALFNTYFDQDMRYLSPTRSALDPSGALDKGIAYYLNDQLETSQLILEEMYEGSEEMKVKERAAFYLGLIYLRKEKTRQAIKYFSSLTSAEKRELSNSSEWLLALCFVKQGDFQQARTWLEPLCNTPGAYQEQACSLLKEEDFM